MDWRILGDLLRWTAVKRELEACRRDFENRFGVTVQFTDEQALKDVFARARQGMLDYLDNMEPPRGRRIIAITIEDICYGLVISDALSVPSAPEVKPKSQEPSDAEFFSQLVRSHAKVCFPLFVAEERVRRLVHEIYPDLEIIPRFHPDRALLIEKAIDEIESDSTNALHVLQWLDLKSIVDCFE